LSTTEIAAALRELASPWLTAEAAAVHLGYAVRTFREKIAVQPGFPPPRMFGGKSMRWKRGELDAWAEQQPMKV
jgi:predicted DNA-binding transcriptional regulator AlpA